MVTPADIGRRATVRADDYFYRFIDGWTGTIEGFAIGQVILKIRQKEGKKFVDKIFYIPAEQLAIVGEPNE